MSAQTTPSRARLSGCSRLREDETMATRFPPSLTLAALGRPRPWPARIASAALLAAGLLMPGLAPDAEARQPETLIETPMLEAAVKSGALPPVAERLPEEPLVVDLADKGREFGRHGGEWKMLISKAKDVRYLVVYGYARLVGVDVDFSLKPDLLKDVVVEQGRKFTLVLRKGHKWSDGAPFTSEDFRYWWEDIVSNEELSPSGPPAELLVDGAPPKVTFPDETTVVFEWPAPNPTFLKQLAGARPPFIYRPAHYLKQFHAKYGDMTAIEKRMAAEKARSWAQLHNRLDDMYNSQNPELPSLQPWVPTASPNDYHFVWKRNPFFHRVDKQGRQLPYMDAVDMTTASSGLIPAKTVAGEANLQARGLPFGEAGVIKAGEERGGYRMYVWKSGVASEIALYPNLNYENEAYRTLMRDARFRRALSLAIKREAINRALYFELATPAAMAMLPVSPLYDEERSQAYARHDPKAANALLDEIGLTKRNAAGIRLLPSGEPLEIVVETAGERPEEEKALQYVANNWAEIGVKLIMRPLDRDILRNRVYAGSTMMAVWFGWDNGVATPADKPEEQTPLRQDTLGWPKWGQHHQTKGEVGEAPDYPPAMRLLELASAWESAADDEERRRIWEEILDIHASEVFAIGLVSGAPQLVVASNDMRNVPEEGVWAWDPGAQFGVYRPDEFFLAK